MSIWLKIVMFPIVTMTNNVGLYSRKFMVMGSSWYDRYCRQLPQIIVMYISI